MYLDTLREILFTDSLYCTIKNNNHNKSVVPPPILQVRRLRLSKVKCALSHTLAKIKYKCNSELNQLLIYISLGIN